MSLRLGQGAGEGGRGGYGLIDGDYRIGARGDILNEYIPSLCRDDDTFFSFPSPYKDSSGGTWDREAAALSTSSERRDDVTDYRLRSRHV